MPKSLRSFRRFATLTLLGASVATVASCQSKPKTESIGLGGIPTQVEPKTPPVEIKAPPSASGDSAPLLARPLTSSGDNSDARFSHDGSRIVFVSRNRTTHKHAQVYEYNIAQRTERRLTFHDGDDASPVWRADGKTIVYSSATDESKEEPFTIERVMKTYYPEGLKRAQRLPAQATVWGLSELYELRIGGEVERLTAASGFDGDLEIDMKTDRLVFSSARTGAPNLFIMDRRLPASRLTQGKFIDRFPHFSPDGKMIVWSRREGHQSNATIMLSEGTHSKARQPKVLTSGPSLDIQPAWHPLGDDIVFVSNRGGRVFNLYTVDKAGTCVKRLTDVASDQFQPSFSPDGKHILFTWQRDAQSQSQIYMMEYRPPKDCWTATAQRKDESPAGVELAPSKILPVDSGSQESVRESVKETGSEAGPEVTREAAKEPAKNDAAPETRAPSQAPAPTDSPEPPPFVN